MLKRRKRSILEGLTYIGAGAVVLATGVFVASMKFPELRSSFSFLGLQTEPQQSFDDLDDRSQESAVLALVGQPSEQRTVELESIARQPKSSEERSRARYLLASDLIDQGQPAAALLWLDELDKDYPLLAAYVLYQQARAFTALKDAEQANETWEELLRRYPNQAVAAEALFALANGDPDSEQWDQAIEQFPSHPRTVEIARIRLQKQPDQVELMLILAKHGLYLPGITSVLSDLVDRHADQLQPEDWEAIGFGFWEKQRYNSAGSAYAKASPTALNLYRAARGAHLGNREGDAIRGYQLLNEEFPDDLNTAQGLLHLASLTDSGKTAIGYLDQVIQRFPSRAADALLVKADRLEDLKSSQSAVQARQSILSQYSDSDAAAELRWQQVERRFENADIKGAWEWAKQLVEENPDSEYAPEAAFWVGKWAAEQGKQAEARQAFEFVLAQYPESYYAWRSASLLGWDVGDFNTVREKLPRVAYTPTPLPIAVGSDILKELHQLGQERDAWALWQIELEDPQQPTVAEQFTDGILRLGVGDNLEAIFMLESLAWRDEPDDRAQYRALRQHAAYWQALYPLLFVGSIQEWSQQRQLNPMLVSALIRQESRFETDIQSPVGATGLMQVMPETAEWISAQTDVGDYELDNPADNIEMGTWYLDYTHQEYSGNSLFAIASYNAGPGNVSDWIVRFGFSDPDRFVEEIPFPETKGYVEAVFENYWNYLRLYNPQVSEQLAQYSSNHASLVGFQPAD